MTAQSGSPTAAKTSVVELTVLVGLCLLAGIGAGLAFASALAGLAVAGIGLVAVTAYALAANIDRSPRARRREEPGRLSVTDISARRRGAAAQVERARQETSPATQPEPEGADLVAPGVVAPAVVATVAPDRVVPFRMPSVRL